MMPTSMRLGRRHVTSFGHRRKLLDAIAALRNDGSAQTPSVSGTRRENINFAALQHYFYLFMLLQSETGRRLR
jgi:hypothetical protein